MISLEKIKLFCTKENLRPVLTHVFRKKFSDGNTYACATNGHILIYVLDNDNELAVPDLPEKLGPCPNIEALFVDLTETEKYVVPLASLREFAGHDMINDPEYQCSECNGAGDLGDCPVCDGEGGKECVCTNCGDSHNHCCDRCNNEGYLICSCKGSGYKYEAMDRRGLLGDHIVDLNYLSTIVNTLDSKTVDLHILPAAKCDVLTFIFNGFRCLLVSRHPYLIDCEFPAFDLTLYKDTP